MAVVRSPYAHARIANVNVDGALVDTSASCARLTRWRARPHERVASASRHPGCLASERGHEETAEPSAACRRRSAYVGDGVAVVIAESRAEARDAAELVRVDYDPLPTVIDAEKALEDGSPLCTKSSAPTAATPGTLRREKSTRNSRRGRHRQGAIPSTTAESERRSSPRRHSSAVSRRRES